jgi:hypothetical protein
MFRKATFQLRLIRQLAVSTGFLGFVVGASATVWIVDNQAHRPADYRSIQAANDSAEVQPGDTLLIQGSSTKYGSRRTTLTKRLTLIGPGNHTLQSVGIPGGELAEIGELVLGVKFIPNTKVVESSSRGTVLLGLHLTGTTGESTGQSLDVSVSDVLVERCNLRGRLQTRQIIGEPNVPVDPIRNLTVLNCLIRGAFLQYGGGHRIEGSRLLHWQGRIERCFVSHCLIMPGRSHSPSSPVMHFEDCAFENSIFQAHANVTLSEYVNCRVAGCVLMPLKTSDFSEVPDLDANLRLSVEQYNDVYVGEGDFPSNLELKAGSPAAGRGIDGVDPGFVSGPRPYVVTGPPIPRITELRVPTVVSQQSGLPVRISAEVRK